MAIVLNHDNLNEWSRLPVSALTASLEPGEAKAIINITQSVPSLLPYLPYWQLVCQGIIWIEQEISLVSRPHLQLTVSLYYSRSH
jgi:hypothetical protein